MRGALGLPGLHAMLAVEGATAAAVLLAAGEPVLAPTLRPGDRVGMDHLRVPNVAGVRQARGGRGARRLSWPPYAPDLSPVEPCWSKRKASLRNVQARPREALERAITQALVTITAAEAQGWFRPCGEA